MAAPASSSLTAARAASAPHALHRRAGAFRPAAPLRLRPRAQENEREPVVSESVLVRLRAAEEETQRLKKELAAAQAVASAAAGVEAAANADAKVAVRIDGGDLRRETLFSVKLKQRNWLSEGDVSFFTGRGKFEADSTEVSTEEEEIVKRRLLLGLLASVGLGAFALVPTQQLQLSKPGKPLFFYLVPLLRSQQLLAEVEQLVSEGDPLVLKALLQRILGSPNNLQQNLRDAAACLPTTREAEQAESIGRDVFEYVQQIDYDKYFESMRGTVRDGIVQKQYYDFSLNSVHAAQAKLREFLVLVPTEQREAAAMQLASMPF